MGQRRRSDRASQDRGLRRPGGSGPRIQRRASRWPALAVLSLVLATGAILLLNQRHSGDPLKVRRELRKF
jgi:hypothetical protein